MAKKTFLIEVPVLVYVTCKVEADSEQDAIDKSNEFDFSLDEKYSFGSEKCSTIGLRDKTVQQNQNRLSIYVASKPFDLSGFDVKVTEL